MIEDAELLRRYAEERSEEAFAELVRRRVNLVYSVALRQVGGDAHLAEDVTQRVFTDLARKAKSLATHAVLSGWLYRSAQFAATDVVRAERRRRVREQEAQIMHESSSPEAPADWEKLRPLLDQVLGELDADDRDVLALRFFEERPFAEVGAALRLNEDAARKRVSRALDKLHGLLARRGLSSTTAALSAVLVNQAGVAAPAGLAASVTVAALAGGSLAGGAGAVAALLTFMSTGKTILGLAGIATVVALGTTFVAAEHRREEEAKLGTTIERQAKVETQLSDLRKRVQAETQRVASAEVESVRLERAVAEQQRLEVAAVMKEQPVTSDVVQARMSQARLLVKNGPYSEALKEMIWLFDVGLKRAQNMGPVRLSFGVALFAELAGKYPPAREALEERREAARQKLLSDAGDRDAVSEYSAITRELKDGAAAIALLEQFPPGDKRRAGLAQAAFDDLIESRRYAVALEGRNARLMATLFEAMTRERPGTKAQPEAIQRQMREGTVNRVVRDIEVLAGAGELTDARTLANRLLAYDSSERTQAALRQHLARAEQANLLSTPSP